MNNATENLNDQGSEDIRVENNILKLKMMAEFGAQFGGCDEIPPELEQAFLQRVLAFETQHATGKRVPIYEFQGKPDFVKESELGDDAVMIELERIQQLMKEQGVELVTCAAYADRVIYKFITEELFLHEMDDTRLPGMVNSFIYEEFHPNHKADIIKQTHAFFQSWFNREFTEHSTELSPNFITADGVQMTREDVIGAMNIFFEAFYNFKDDGYNIDNVNFDLQETGEGMGFAEGMLKYDAVMDNGEAIRYEGPYKLYMQLEYNWWSIFYFVMPGFKW